VDITETIVIRATPDAVWKVGGDVGNISEWVPAIETSHLDGDIRHATFAGGGGEATERIVERDDAARAYVYEYLSGPLALEEYRSRFAVQPHPEGAEVVWSSTFSAGSAEEEAGLAEAIGGIYRSALHSLKDRLAG
jgi:Polyketide cyclase / dehydrase and lipid transport